jgi:amino acid adenylation domain-containing protein
MEIKDLDLSEIELQNNPAEDCSIEEINQHDIAVLGISIRFPFANSLTEFDKNLRHGFECLKPFPKKRKEFADKYLRLKNIKEDFITYHKGGYIDDIDSFDYHFFGIPPKEAALMDPHQRMFLQVAWEAIENGGYGGNKLSDTHTGVYMGYTPGTEIFDYRQVVSDLEYDKISMAIPGNLHSIMPSRIGYFLDLKGPSLLVDTACSSSLVAVHLACRGLRNGDCDYAIAGGARLTLFPLAKFGRIGIESSDGRTRPFDDKADGTGVGEGVAALLLKPLHKAIEHHDHIYAVIKGSAINQDGASAGITAPNVKAQENVILRAWADAGIDPCTLDYIEAHGTGTKIGDPIEIQSISNAFTVHTNKKQFCSIGSVKSNIGHLYALAGIAGLVKCILSLQNKKLYPSINYKQPNRSINFKDSAVVVNSELKTWLNGIHPRRCGINSFGFSGTNCHVVIEEAPKILESPENTIKAEIFSLSAKSESALKNTSQKYVQYLKSVSDDNNITLRNICYTANSGRGQYEHRIATIVKNKTDLLHKLEKFYSNKSAKSDDFFENTVNIKNQKVLREMDREAESICISIPESNGNYENLARKLCHIYVKGANVNWNNIYHTKYFRRQHIPFYAFNKTDCSLDIPDELPENEIFNSNITKTTPRSFPLREKITVKLFGNGNNNYTEFEKQVAQTWGNVLGYTELNVNENFFHLGGESITLMQIVQRLSEQYDMHITMKDFMQDATIKGLASFIKGNNGKTKRIEYPQQLADPENMYQPFPVTDIQMAYLMGRDKSFELGGIGTHIYSEIESAFDIDRLNIALNKVIARHPMLRAVFLPESQQQQILSNIPEYKIAYRDISTLSGNEQQKEIIRERDRMSHNVFDPSKWPLFELTAFKTDEDKNYLFFGYDMLIADGLSIQIFENELVQFCKNPELELSALDFTFRDYMLAYENFRQSKHYLADKAYHLNKLEDLPIGPSLLINRPLAKIDNPVFFRKQHIFDKAKWKKLKSISKQMQVTPSALILTVYAKVLDFWCPEDRFTINLTVFNRYPFSQDVNKIIGDFTSVILMSIDFSEEKPFDERIRQINMDMMEALSHRHFEGVSVIRELARNNNTGTKALMPVVFTSMLIDEKTSEFELKERLGKFTFGVSQTSQVYLDNQLTENNGELSVTWDYEKTVFDAKVIDSMFYQYISVIDSIIDNEPMARLSIDNQDKQLITKYNKTDNEFVVDTLDNLFYKQLEENAKRIAAKSEFSELNYQELNTKSNKIAHYLIEQGVKNNTCVAVIAHRRADTIAYILGILKAGGTYVPIEPDYPEDRREYVLTNSNVELILDSDTFELRNMTKYPDKDVKDRSKSDKLAYIIYTSGSTGRPKGVMITHKAAANTIIDINRRFSITSEDKILGLSSMCFDLSVYDIFGALSTGASLNMVPDIKNTEKIADIIAEEQITFWNSVPSVMNLMTENLSINENKKFVKYLSLRNVLLSGDWIPVDIPEKIKNYFPKANVTSLGGATEASIWSICYPIDEVKPEWKSIPYGYPLSNQKFYVLNRDLEFCPVGVEGELFIGGKGVASGYMNDMDKTKNSFIDHPELGYIYRTGDYGIFHKEGHIEFMGRKDAQVKIRGHRIELGEIEANLLQHGGINQAIVLATEFEQGDKKIVAYVTPSYMMDWDYENSKKLLEARQKYLRLPFTGDVELKISGKPYQTKAVDLSSLALTVEGNYDANELVEAVFTLPGKLEKTALKGEIVIITQNLSVIIFKDKNDRINSVEVALDEYKKTIPFEKLRNEFAKLDLKLKDQCKIKLESGSVVEFTIRQLTSDGVAFTGITEEMKKEMSHVEIEFIIEGLSGTLTIPGKIEWTKNNISGVKFTKTNETINSLLTIILNYSLISGISAQILKDYLKNAVPDYMVPSAFTIIDYMPLTGNQKIDRKRLPSPSVVQEETKSNKTEPRNAIERKIFEIWSEILKTDAIGIEDNFFELGGDSLQIYQIAMRAEAEYKVKIPIDNLYKEPTIANISLFILDSLKKLGQEVPMNYDQTNENTNIVYYWTPAAIWKLKDGKVIIDENIYDAADLFPKFYFLTQDGCDIETIIEEFKGKDEAKIRKVAGWFIKDGILVDTITSWHKIFSPYKKLFDNKYDQDLLFNKEKYNQFKEEQMNRNYDGGLKVSMELSKEDELLPETLSKRRSFRNFNTGQILSYKKFSLLMTAFVQRKENNNVSYHYASSGALYPIDIYLYIKENRVENVERGLYFYHPATHRLNLISKEKISESSAYVKNKEIFKSSAITMYMVFNAESSMPVYGGDGYFYACLDTGIMVSTLTQVAETCNVGLCSIGDMNFDVIKDQFKLNSHQVLLHTIELGIKPDKALTYNEVIEVYEKNKASIEK